MPDTIMNYMGHEPETVQSSGRIVTFDFPFGTVVLHAGPYRNIPRGFAGIKLAEEISKECAVHLPIRDFSVPEYSAQVENALIATIALGRAGSPLYAGCMGGMGRTGLFLALLQKVAQRSSWTLWQRLTERPTDPVVWVRKHYHPNACETREQVAYVHAFNTQRVERVVKRM